MAEALGFRTTPHTICNEVMTIRKLPLHTRLKLQKALDTTLQNAENKGLSRAFRPELRQLSSVVDRALVVGSPEFAEEALAFAESLQVQLRSVPDRPNPLRRLGS